MWAAIVVAVVAIWLGVQISIQGSQPGFGSLGGAVLTMFIGAIVVLLLLVSGVTAPFERTRDVAPLAFGGGCLLTVGVVIGAIIAPVVGLTYRPPIERSATGQVSLELLGVGQFASSGPSPATCRAELDSEAVKWVSALGVATLQSMPLNVWLTPAIGDEPGARLEVHVNAEAPAEQMYPSWGGAIDPADYPPDWTAGTVRVADLQIGFQPLPMAGSWPDHLRGTLTWQCEGWQTQ